MLATATPFLLLGMLLAATFAREEHKQEEPKPPEEPTPKPEEKPKPTQEVVILREYVRRRPPRRKKEKATVAPVIEQAPEEVSTVDTPETPST